MRGSRAGDKGRVQFRLHARSNYVRSHNNSFASLQKGNVQLEPKGVTNGQYKFRQIRCSAILLWEDPTVQLAANDFVSGVLCFVV